MIFKLNTNITNIHRLRGWILGGMRALYFKRPFERDFTNPNLSRPLLSREAGCNANGDYFDAWPAR